MTRAKRSSRSGQLRLPGQAVPLAEDEVISACRASRCWPSIDRYIWPGPMPSAVETNIKIALERHVFYNGEGCQPALPQNAEDSECFPSKELAMSVCFPEAADTRYADEAKRAICHNHGPVGLPLPPALFREAPA